MSYCIRILQRGGMYWAVHPRQPRDLIVGWDVQYNTPLIIYPSLLIGKGAKGKSLVLICALPVGIGSFKINPSVTMLRESFHIYVAYQPLFLMIIPI